MDTGSNRPAGAVNVESIAEVKVLTSSYQAEYGRSSGLQITAVTKSGTNRFRGSVYDVERNSDWNANSKDEHAQRRPEDRSRSSATGAIRSAGRSASRAATTSCSSSTRRSSSRARPATTSSASACRPRSSERATSRRRPTTTATSINLIRDTSIEPARACTATDTRGCFQDGGVLGRSRRPALSAGPEHPEDVPAAEHRRPCRARPTTTRSRGRRRACWLSAGAPPRLPAAQKLRAHASSTPGWTQRKQIFNGSIPGFNDTRMQNPVVVDDGGDGQLHPEPDDVPRGHLRAAAATSRPGCALDGRRAELLHRRAADEPDSNRINAGLGDLPFLFPDANVLNPDYYAYEVDERRQAADLGRHADPDAAGLHAGAAASPTAPPNMPFPGFLNVNRT